jgi:hypothetical protein
MSSRQRYQYGSLTRRRRIRGEDVWQFRFYETTGEGLRERRTRTIGTVAQYPTRADALRAIESFRLRLNLQHGLGGQRRSERLQTITLNRNCLSYATQHSSRT